MLEELALRNQDFHAIMYTLFHGITQAFPLRITLYCVILTSDHVTMRTKMYSNGDGCIWISLWLSQRFMMPDLASTAFSSRL